MHCGGSQPRIIEQEGPGAPIMTLGVSWDFFLPAQGHRAGPSVLLMALTVSWDFCSQPRIIEQEGPCAPVMALRVNWDFCSIWHHCGWATHVSQTLPRLPGIQGKARQRLVEATLLTSWGPGA